jgi:hypothetical protein
MASKIYTSSEKADRSRPDAERSSSSAGPEILHMDLPIRGGATGAPDKFAEFARALKMNAEEFTREQLRFLKPEVYKIPFGSREGPRRHRPPGSST